MEKISAEVIAHFNLNGEIIPLKIKVNVGGEERSYVVNKPSKPVRGASLKIGVQGNRYSCYIDGKKAFLYQNHENKWFLDIC